MSTYGYVRVSSHDQNEDRQMISLRDIGIPERRIFLDKQSGKILTALNTKDYCEK